MKFYFRTEAGADIGFGHIFRCLSLAKEIAKLSSSFDICFIINDDEHAKNLVSSKGYDFLVLDNPRNEENYLLSKEFTTDKSIFIFDNLVAYQASFILKLSKFNKIVLIQCYSEARFYSDLSIYPVAHLDEKFLNDDRWIDSNSKLISGIQYCLLNEKITNFKPRKTINTPPKIISLIAGGSDPTSSLLKISKWLDDFVGLDVQIYCQYGLGASYINQIRDINLNNQINFCEFSLDLCADSDLAICAFGVTVYELTYLNIPVLTYGHTPKHAVASKRYCERFGSTFHLGFLDEMTKESFLFDLENILLDSRAIKKMHFNARNLVDGEGVKKISKLIAGLSND